MNETHQVTFKVPDMSCGHCVATIREALEKSLPGAQVDVDLANTRVSVRGNEEAAEAAIREAGYSPERI